MKLKISCISPCCNNSKDNIFTLEGRTAKAFKSFLDVHGTFSNNGKYYLTCDSATHKENRDKIFHPLLKLAKDSNWNVQSFLHQHNVALLFEVI